MKRIMGIDPGNELTAYTIFIGDEDRTKGQLVQFAKAPNAEVMYVLKSKIMNGEIDVVAIEGLQSFGMPVGQSTFQTAYQIGRFLQLCDQLNMQNHLVYRGDIKSHFCQSRKAKDGNIRQSLIDRFGEPGVKASPGILYKVSADVWSSTAIAVYAHDLKF